MLSLADRVHPMEIHPEMGPSDLSLLRAGKRAVSKKSSRPSRSSPEYKYTIARHELNPCTVEFEKIKQRVKDGSSYVSFDPAEEVYCKYNFNHRGMYQEYDIQMRSNMFFNHRTFVGVFFLNWDLDGKCKVHFKKNPTRKHVGGRFKEVETPTEVLTLINSIVTTTSDREGDYLSSECNVVPMDLNVMHVEENAEDRSFSVSNPEIPIELFYRDARKFEMLVKPQRNARNFPNVYVLGEMDPEEKGTSGNVYVMTPCSGTTSSIRITSDSISTKSIELHVDGVDAVNRCPWSGSSTLKLTVEILDIISSAMEQKFIVREKKTMSKCEADLDDEALRECRGSEDWEDIPATIITLLKYGKTFYDRAAGFRPVHEGDVRVCERIMKNMYNVDVVEDALTSAETMTRLQTIKAKDSVVVIKNREEDGPEFEPVSIDNNPILNRLDRTELPSGKDYSNIPLSTLIKDLEKCAMTGPVCCDVLSHFLKLRVRGILGHSVERFGESIADDYAYPITGMLKRVSDIREHVRTCKNTYREVAVRVDKDVTRSSRKSKEGAAAEEE